MVVAQAPRDFWIAAMTADIPLAPANVRSNLWNVALLYATQALRLVEKEIAVAGRRLRILVDSATMIAWTC